MDIALKDDYNPPMNRQEILDLIRRGQNVRCQFKANVTNAKSVGAELVAFANSFGGVLIIGVSDAGQIVGLTKEQVRGIHSLVTEAASDYACPPMEFTAQNVRISRRTIVAITIPPGEETPYLDADGVGWQRAGTGKRRIRSPQEYTRLLQNSGLLHGDTMLIPDAGPESIDLSTLATVMQILKWPVPLSAEAAWLQMKRMGLVRSEHLTFAGLLLFAESPQQFKPQFWLKARHFQGNDESSTTYIDNEEVVGRLKELFYGGLAFLRRNLRRVQIHRSINSRGEMEIPENVLEELLCNALLHRDYLVDAPIRLLIFSNRIEIISPGSLSGGLSIDSIKRGALYPRNPRLISFAIRGLLPYSGLGQGIPRILKSGVEIEFVDDVQANHFRVIVKRRRGRALQKGRRPRRQSNDDQDASELLFRTRGQMYEQARANMRPQPMGLGGRAADTLRLSSAPRA